MDGPKQTQIKQKVMATENEWGQLLVATTKMKEVSDDE
jgi:hypothetical protein